MSTALKYNVDTSGRVDTNGFFREISEVQWQSLPAIPKYTSRRYGPVMDAIAQGKIVGIPSDNTKKAWNTERTLKQVAARLNKQIDVRRVRDPQKERGVLVLVRTRR